MTDFIGEDTEALLTHEEVQAIFEALMEDIHSPKCLIDQEIDIRFHAHNSYLQLQSLDDECIYNLVLHTNRTNDYITSLEAEWNFVFMPFHQEPLFRVDCGTGPFHIDPWLDEIFDKGHIHLSDDGIVYALTIEEARDSDILHAIVDISLGEGYEDLTSDDVLRTILIELGVSEEEADDLKVGFRYALSAAN